MIEEIIYTTKDGDRLDELVYKRYGKERGAVEWLFSNNAHLRDQPVMLPAGIEINMPPLPEKATVVTVNPWSR